MYINALECALSRGNTGVTIDDVKLFLLFYADDAVIFAESIEELQNGINIFHDYCNRWKLMLNTEKSQIVFFKKGRQRSHEKWKYGEKELNVVTSLSYLGIRVSATGSFHQAQKTLTAQASKAVFSLSKNILGVKTSVQNDFVYGELHRLPMKYARTVNILKYWLKIVRGEKSLYVNTCYLSSLKMLDASDTNCWARCVKCMLESNGFSDVWLCQGVGDRDLFVKIFTERLSDVFFQNWSEILSMSSRAIFYKCIKLNWSFVQYLELVNVTQHRKSLCKLIVSSHRLRIETGRWERPPVPREMRQCEICHQGVEDEFHFVCVCPAYVHIRKKYIKQYHWKRPSMFKLVQLFNTENRKAFNGLA